MLVETSIRHTVLHARSARRPGRWLLLLLLLLRLAWPGCRRLRGGRTLGLRRLRGPRRGLRRLTLWRWGLRRRTRGRRWFRPDDLFRLGLFCFVRLGCFRLLGRFLIRRWLRTLPGLLLRLLLLLLLIALHHFRRHAHRDSRGTFRKHRLAIARQFFLGVEQVGEVVEAVARAKRKAGRDQHCQQRYAGDMHRLSFCQRRPRAS